MDADSNGHERTDFTTEYNSLRAEILQRIGQRQQFISMTLTVAGVFLGLGVTTETIALVYPPLAAFLAIAWHHNEHSIKRLAIYIRSHLEPSTPNLGWETYVQRKRKKANMRPWYWIIMYSGGIFYFTQIMAIGIGLLKFTSTPLEWFLLGIDLIIVLLMTNWVVKQVKKWVGKQA